MWWKRSDHSIDCIYGSDIAVLFKMAYMQYIGNDIFCNCLKQGKILECQIENTWSGAIRFSKVGPGRFTFVLCTVPPVKSPKDMENIPEDFFLKSSIG